VRRPAVLLSIALLAAALLARRLRRRRAATAPLPAPGAATPAAPATRFLSVPWTLVAAPAGDARLTIRYAGDERMELDRVDAQETPTQVFVTVLMRWRPPPAGGRSAGAQEREAVVPLAAPLAKRELVHAPVDDPGAPPLYP
jgi:hypothetical protein